MDRVITIKNNKEGVRIEVVFTMDKAVRFKKPIKLEVLQGWSEVDKNVLKGKVDFYALNLTSEAITSITDVEKAVEELVGIRRLLVDLELEAAAKDSSIEDALFGVLQTGGKV